jgi:hypothetical protein
VSATGKLTVTGVSTSSSVAIVSTAAFVANTLQISGTQRKLQRPTVRAECRTS